MTVWLQRFINHEFLKLLLYLKRKITTRKVVYGSAGGKKCWVWPQEKILVKDDLTAK